ncbi:mucosa-associated lymphoid tissue lymphoma translocation protein 1-like isoform X2 [Salvelinus fontinalis]|uniref:mucosa-associated lymphoid tissue lymphoma translocation protein 1-like isoform X2 n=1 Tax=Salvelinus fontinalis TaxID=8038 RepID=UPI00248634C4|nr:mucosa-associated lymphoid tissue lymphoma translocation protein 1-like isoform X2 [Salvelinus fontinalis]
MKNMIRDIVIVQHPVSVYVPLNYKVTLSVRAEGTGILNYQWFKSSKEEVFGGTRADLIVTAQRSQLYICRVNDQFCNCVFSEWVKVKVLDIAKPGLPVAWRGEPHIAVHPAPQTVRQGERLTLSCTAFGIPTPHYQWYRNGHPLLGKTTDTLQIENAESDHRGTYLCYVSNVLEERWTEAADVEIVPSNQLTATDKVALLIGNLNYSHHPDLMAPTMDVHELANLLQQLGFRVVSLLDLTREEMLAAIDKFLLLLDRGVYALFYYAGHGYERLGRNYLVAVDAPQPYRPENCVCVQRVMRKMQERRTVLNVVLLDTCRTWYNQDCIASEIRPLVPMGNTVYGYATCENAEAYEVQDGGKSTGIFTKYLNKHILQPEKVTHILELVSEDLGRDPFVTGKQAVEIKHTLKEPRSLTDPIRTTGHTGELHMRDACWRQANVKTTGPRAQDCTIALRSTPAMEDIFSSPGRSGEMDSLLLNNLVAENPDCSLRLCGLQKLQGSLVIKVDLHYTHMDRKLRLQESKQLDIGKPLVASCDLHRGQQAMVGQRPDGATAQSMGHSRISHSKQRPRQTLGQPGRPFTKRAECAAKVLTARSNEPGENDETEPQDFTS